MDMAGTCIFACGLMRMEEVLVLALREVAHGAALNWETAARC